MRKTKNEVTVIGYLYDHNLEVKQVKNEASENFGKNFISGKIDIATDEEGLNIVSVHYTYVAPTFKSGSENRSYKIMENLISTGKTWINDGKDNATLVRATPSLLLNDWYDKDGNLVSNLRCEGGFLNEVKTLPDVNERNKFTADMVITGVQRVMADPDNNIDEDYLKIKGAVFDFRNAVHPSEFVLRNPKGIDYMESLSYPIFTGVFGQIVNRNIVTKTITETAFGDPVVNTSTKRSREYLIVNLAATPYDFGGEDITTEELQKAIQDRNIHLEEEKTRAAEYRASANNATPASKPAAGAKDPTVSVSFGDFQF